MPIPAGLYHRDVSLDSCHVQQPHSLSIRQSCGRSCKTQASHTQASSHTALRMLVDHSPARALVYASRKAVQSWTNSCSPVRACPAAIKMRSFNPFARPFGSIHRKPNGLQKSFAIGFFFHLSSPCWSFLVLPIGHGNY